MTRVTVGAGALDARAEALSAWLAGRTVFVLSSAPVLALHGPALAGLEAVAARWLVLEAPDGEAAKTLGQAEALWRRMLAAGGKRDSRVIAFGGGTLGDLGGFVAACFLRGVELVHLPTTLLAQVDAALGGKTAVNLPEGKNTVGAFHHPAEVVADTRFLATLPAAELRSGLMEVVKIAIALDAGLFERLEAELERLLEGDPVTLAPVVAAAARAKIAVVERDPREGGDRKLLNLGHTLAHAIESVLGYAGLRHGEAVGYGLLFALRLAARLGMDPAEVRRCRRLVARCHLPELPPLALDDLTAALRRDKKAREAGLAWVLPRAIGRSEIVAGLGEERVLAELEHFLEDPGRAG